MPESGSDTVKGVIDLGDDVVLDSQLRVGGARWLAKKTGKSLMQLTAGFEGNDWDIEDFVLIFMALYLQRHPDESEESPGFKKASARIDTLGFGELTEYMGDVFSFEAKNSQASEVELTETTPTPE